MVQDIHMEETYNTKVIVLNKVPFRENDCRVLVYSLERGKIDLVARGARKISSKISGHIEPLTECRIMAVRGRNFDYVGSALAGVIYPRVKNNLEKIEIAGKAVQTFNNLIKEEEPDKNIYFLLREFLDLLSARETGNHQLLYSSYVYKLLFFLGYKPELENCVLCKNKIEPDNNHFDFSRGGLICTRCEPTENKNIISENAIKILRLVEKNNLNEMMEIKTEDDLSVEIKRIVDGFLEYTR
ncbi:MAG: DNA repair protein RecO [bacterium]